MSYDFSSLSPIDFEELARDLIGAELGIRFEAFGVGRDGGIDGRHASDGKTTILQAKHYQNSSFSQLLKTMENEKAKLDKLAISRYILVTSISFTPGSKKKLFELLQPYCINISDIYGTEDLNSLLKKFPDVEKTHFKLWMSSTKVIEDIFNAKITSYTSRTKEDILEKVKLYVMNESYHEAIVSLQKRKILIVTGAPGVGKSTLAEIIIYKHYCEEWEIFSISNIIEAFQIVHNNHGRKIVIYFDDFLGSTELSQNRLDDDNDLERFIRYVEKQKNIYLILTSRLNILKDAQRQSDRIASKKIEISKYVLNVGVYTRNIKTMIVYNHLYYSNLDYEFKLALINSNNLLKIIDHKNFFPRLISSMTISENAESISAQEYATKFLDYLNNPKEIWEKTFNNKDDQCKHLLYCLYFFGDHLVEIKYFSDCFDILHRRLCADNNIKVHVDDFKIAIKSLEGTFISISDGHIGFSNPSVRDFMKDIVKDERILLQIAPAACNFRWALNLLGEYESLTDSSNNNLKKIIIKFDEVKKLTNYSTGSTLIHYIQQDRKFYDFGKARKMMMLYNWWEITNDETFIDCTIKIANNGDTIEIENLNYDFLYFINELQELINLDFNVSKCTNKSLFINLYNAIFNLTLDCLDSLEKPSQCKEIIECLDESFPNIYLNIYESIQLSIQDILDFFLLNLRYIDSVDELDYEIDSINYLLEKKLITQFIAKQTIGIIHARVDSIDSYDDSGIAEQRLQENKPMNKSSEISDSDIFNLFSTITNKKNPQYKETSESAYDMLRHSMLKSILK